MQRCIQLLAVLCITLRGPVFPSGQALPDTGSQASTGG